MKTMKKILLVVITISLITGCGCSKKEEVTTEGPKVNTI